MFTSLALDGETLPVSEPASLPSGFLLDSRKSGKSLSTRLRDGLAELLIESVLRTLRRQLRQFLGGA